MIVVFSVFFRKASERESVLGLVHWKNQFHHSKINRKSGEMIYCQRTVGPCIIFTISKQEKGEKTLKSESQNGVGVLQGLI